MTSSELSLTCLVWFSIWVRFSLCCLDLYDNVYIVCSGAFSWKWCFMNFKRVCWMSHGVFTQYLYNISYSSFWIILGTPGSWKKSLENFNNYNCVLENLLKFERKIVWNTTCANYAFSKDIISTSWPLLECPNLDKLSTFYILSWQEKVKIAWQASLFLKGKLTLFVTN